MTTERRATRTVLNRRHTLVAACLAALSAVGCGRNADPRQQRESSVTVQFAADEGAVGPSYDAPAQFLVFLPLVTQNAAGALEAKLARSWEPSDDYSHWTVHLDTRVRWHDGAPVTADDIAFSVELLSRPEVGYIGPGTIDITVVDDSTFVFSSTMSSPLSDYRTYYPKHLLQALDPANFYEWEFWTETVGNGPYRYVRHVPKTMMELEANPDFYAGEPAIARVVLKFSTANKLIELTSGNVDAILNVNHSDVPRLEADPRFGVYHVFAFTEPQALLWNHRHPLLSDPIVRRALWQAIDRRELLEILDFPEETPVLGGLFAWERTGQLLREGRLDEGFAYDPEVARELLERAGWLDPDGDGTRERNGVEARFTLLASSGGLVSIREPSVFIQDQLRNVGVEMEIHTVSASVAREAYRSGDFDAVIGDVPNVPEWLLQRDWFGESSRIGYVSPEIIRLLEALTVDLDPNSQDSLYARINEILHRDMPFTLLFPWVETFAAHSRIRGLSTPDRGHPLMYMDELWLEGER